MPRSAEHQQKAKEGYEFLEKSIGIAPPAWRVVVAFYTALHLVERLAACESLHHAKHQDRLDYVKTHKHHRAIYQDFSNLFDASLIARYGTVNNFNKAYPDDTVEEVLINKHLKKIEQYVEFHFAALNEGSGA